MGTGTRSAALGVYGYGRHLWIGENTGLRYCKNFYAILLGRGDAANGLAHPRAKQVTAFGLSAVGRGVRLEWQWAWYPSVKGFISIHLGQVALLLLQQVHQRRSCFSPLALAYGVRIGRISDGRQNPNDRYGDHELYESETPLGILLSE